jgi:hypothetical protein
VFSVSRTAPSRVRLRERHRACLTVLAELGRPAGIDEIIARLFDGQPAASPADHEVTLVVVRATLRDLERGGLVAIEQAPVITDAGREALAS